VAFRTASNLFILAAALTLSSCGSVTPIVRESETASFDGNSGTSGVVEFLPDGGLEITPSAYERYCALTAIYGERFHPRLKLGFGTQKKANGNYSLTLEAADKWHRMIGMQERDRINNAK